MAPERDGGGGAIITAVDSDDSREGARLETAWPQIASLGPRRVELFRASCCAQPNAFAGFRNGPRRRGYVSRNGFHAEADELW